MDDRFEQVWSRPGDYPETHLRPLKSHEYHERNCRREKLEREHDSLFDHTQQKIEFWEIEQDNKFGSHEFGTIHEMKTHLDKTKNAPQIRHTFLESDDSRSPVNCHPDLLKSLFTYHQVEPSFLDAIQTFGDQDDPKDLSLMNFNSSDTLTVRNDKLIAIPKLNRSGREINMSYLLRAPEAKKNKDWKWQIRQAAVYHSFDTETGKSFWCTIKGNDEFNKRIKRSSPYLELPSPNSTANKTEVADYFAASLATHMVYFAWCDESWRDFINDIEDGIRRPLEMARSAPIDDDLEDTGSKLKTYPRSLRDTRRNSTMRSNKTPGGTAQGSKANSKRNTGLSARPGTLRKRTTMELIEGAHRALLRYMTGSSIKPKVSDPEKDAAGAPAASATGGLFVVDDNASSRSSEEGRLIDTREVLNKFRFSDVQTLYTFSDRIRRAILTLTLNISVLGEMHEYFTQRLLNSDLESFRRIREGCRDNGDAIGEFLREVKSLCKRLETRRTQLECLGVLLAEGNSLYDGILQYRQLDISQRFQETSRRSADHMQVMANKTRVETASMHVITVVTMIFLPATFVATFFQSGVFLWNDESPSQVDVMEQTGESYKYRADGFTLFAAVSVPMMVVTVGVWLYVFLSMRRSMARGMGAPSSRWSWGSRASHGVATAEDGKTGAGALCEV
ncbi:hypothetical protein V8F33_011109 [Rhypophila sp. PSN 637]